MVPRCGPQPFLLHRPALLASVFWQWIALKFYLRTPMVFLSRDRSLAARKCQRENGRALEIAPRQGCRDAVPSETGVTQWMELYGN